MEKTLSVCVIGPWRKFSLIEPHGKLDMACSRYSQEITEEVGVLKKIIFSLPLVSCP